ncbi:Transposon TX1 uncharacterized 149 kDa protein [Vitis vinifera]|uniref:Transposon TX1 uncharacterized 149 kDa protein n=1 Tax=Vitis vinifera TaxID=29760 RepID=A0A438DFX4_VITVI|nr:Transposon TX1 uncharacterized 149 kDa protein [Vitis vinifera]
MKVCSPAPPLSNSESNTEEEILKNWETEDLRKRNMKILHSATDSTLVEEALRYGSVPLLRGERVSGSSHLIPFIFYRAPEGEHYDRSRNVGVEPQFEVPLCVLPGEGSEENVNSCWDLVETNGGSDKYRGEEWGSGLNDPQAVRGEKEDRWEESSLAKFSHFLGFLTEGLEKEILDFFIKIRKRRERIHGKVLLEKSKFERELKRLECSVNYEKGRKQKDPSQGNKIQSMSKGVVRSLGSGRFLDWRALDASGAAGGILICWDKRTLEILDWEEGQFSLSCRFKNVENGTVWVFTGVYGPFTREERECLWEEIGAIRGLWEDPWCVRGDFNITLFQRERSRQGRITSAMRRFAQIADELGLMDIPLQGGVFTWSGGPNNQSWARLDRFLVNTSWLDQFSSVLQSRLPRPLSDHFPVLLEGGGLRRGPSPFKFENMWLKVEGFQDMIRSWWWEVEVRGSASFRLATKLKEIKQKLKVWNKEVFGNLGCNKAAALQQVELWDRVESERILSVEETELKKEAKENYKKWVLLEETHWRQLSREIWLREGDRNTGSEGRSGKRIPADAFKDSGWQADIGRLHLDQISQQEAENLESPFSEAEVHSALMEMNGDKAPGPDGFTVAFWQSCWGFVKEILAMFKEFHEQNTFLKSLNNTFLVLIPKKGGAEDIGDFRPISLLGGLYKLLAKVLANRLKKVIGKVVSPAQNAFVMGRQILDASLIANEVIDSWQKRKEKGVICKLDIEKAYDSLNWQFLMKGLRQGDPLSPYLFVMGMEVLGILIRRAVEGGFLSSEIIPVGEVDDIEELAVELGCRVGSLPSQYLGLPLGAPNKASSVWDGVEERVRRRLALWKRQFISKGGRITLIKSTLASIPIYQMSFFRMPKIVVRRLEKLQRDFLWGGGNMERKVHLVKWEIVCGDKGRGGLGLRKLGLLNKALLGKWIWRFACDRENLWKQVILAKFGQEEYGWRSKKPNGAFGVGLWKEIMKETDWCWDNLEFMVGKGTKIKFWTDVWCAGTALSQTFPHLFALAANRNATVEEMWDQNSDQGGWNLRFLRNFNDWEVGMVGDLLLKLRGLRPSLEEDSVSWKGGKTVNLKSRKRTVV